MPCNVLVTEGDSPLGAALVRLLLSRGCAVVTTRASVHPTVGVDATDMPLFDSSPCTSIPWNRKSPVSSRNVLVSALNALGSIDEVFILECLSPKPGTAYPPNVYSRTAEGGGARDGVPAERVLAYGGSRSEPRASSTDVERVLDDAKGAIFLSRESLSHFQKSRAGLLCMVSYSHRAADEPSPALERAAHECFHGYASALLSSPIEEGIRVNGFQASGAAPEEFAAFIDKSLDEKGRKVSGRWFTCQAKGGFLQGVWAPGQKRS